MTPIATSTRNGREPLETSFMVSSLTRRILFRRHRYSNPAAFRTSEISGRRQEPMKRPFLAVPLVFSMQCWRNPRAEGGRDVSHGATLCWSSCSRPAISTRRWSSFTAREIRRGPRRGRKHSRRRDRRLVYDKRGAGKSGGEYEGNQSVSEKNIPFWRTMPFGIAVPVHSPIAEGHSRRIRRYQSGRLDRAAGRRNEATSRNFWCCGAARSAR